MTSLIRQRFDNDCTLCCIAMATGLSWEVVFSAALWVRLGYRPVKGTYSALAVCTALGHEAKSYVNPFGLDADGIRAWVWGRRAILSVPSLNGHDGWHDVYWDGAHVFDPSPKKTYPDDIEALTPDGMVVFAEGGRSAFPVATFSTFPGSL